MLQIPLPEVRRTEALDSVSDQKQKIRAVKGDLVPGMITELNIFSDRVQNGLMTVVGMGVMAYLTNLDSLGPGS